MWLQIGYMVLALHYTNQLQLSRTRTPNLSKYINVVSPCLGSLRYAYAICSLDGFLADTPCYVLHASIKLVVL
jgi:hypothetical protein